MKATKYGGKKSIDVMLRVFGRLQVVWKILCGVNLEK